MTTTKGGVVAIIERMRAHRERRAKLVHVLGLRFDDELMERVEERARAVEQEVGLQVSRHDVVRVLIELGLETAESRARE